MIDESQTRREFGEFCRDLQAARNGDWKIQQRLLSRGREATDHMERLQSDASHLPEIFNDIARSYTREELRLLRTGRSLTDGVLSKTLTNIKVVVTSLFRNHPKINRLPPRNEFGSTYLFRLELCAYVWALRWVSVGGAPQAKSEKLRNDMVDISFVVYGSFFDGLPTADAKAAELYRDVVWWLNALREQLRRRAQADVTAANSLLIG